MAAPVDAGRATYSGTASVTSHAVNLPASISAGDILLMTVRVPGGNVPQQPSGWITLVTAASPDPSDDQQAIWYKKATGSEGSTQTVTTITAAKLAAVTWRITGGADPTVYTPDISTVATGTSTTPNPTAVTPSRGTDDYLFLWVGGWEGEQTSPPASQPTNYSNPAGADTGTAGAVAGNCRVAGASRGVTGTSAAEDPGSWTISASDDWSAWAVAIWAGPIYKTGTDSATGTDASAQYPVVVQGRTDSGGIALSSGNSGFIFAASAENVDTAALPWTNPGNVTADDGNNASCSFSSIQTTDDLYAYSYGISLQNGVTPVGVEVQFDVTDSGWNPANGQNIYVTLQRAAGSSPNSKALSNTLGLQTLGSPTDLWGWSSLSESDVENIAFGVNVWATQSSASALTVAIDFVKVKVYYTWTTDEVAVTASDSSAKSGVDSATGSDASAQYPTAAIPTTESPSGADVSALAAVLPGVTDSGAGTEASYLQQTKDVVDSGTGADASSLAAALATTDTGTDTETSSLVVAVAATDTGSGAEASYLQQTKDVTDAGTGTEGTGVITVPVATSDTGKGVEGNAPVFTDYDTPDLDSATNATSYATPSWTPPTKGLALAFISGRANTGSGASPDSVTGNGVTWVKVATVLSGTRSFDLFAADLTGATTGSVTIDFGVDLQNYCTALFTVVDDADLSGGVAAAFAQSVTATGSTGTPSFLMAPASSPINRAIAGFVHGANEATTPKGTWTELDDSAGSADNRGTEVSYFPDWFDAEVSATWATTSVAWLALATEVKGLGREYVDAAIPVTESGTGTDVATVVAVLSAFDVGQEVTVPLIVEQSDWDPAWPTWSASGIDSITAENDGTAASVTVPATGDMLSEDLQYRDWYVDAPTGWDAWSGGRVYVLATIASTGGVGGGALQVGLVKTGLTGGWVGAVSPDPTPPFSGRYLFEIPVRGGDPNGSEATYILTPAAVASTGFGVDFAVYTTVGGGTTTVAIDKVSLVARPSLDSGAVTAQVSASDTGTGSESVTVFTRDGITDSGTLSGEVAVTASADATPVNTTDTGSGTDSTVAPTVNFTSSVVGPDYGGNPWDYGQPLQSFTSVTNSDWGAYPEWTNATTAALQSADGNVVSVTAGPDTFSEDLRVLNWGISAQGDRVQHVYVEFSAEVPFPGTNRSILYIQLTRDGGSTGFRTFSLQAPLSGPMTIRFDVTGNNLTRSQVESANFGVLFYLDTPVPEGGQASIEYVKLGLKYEQEVVSLDRSQSPVTDTGAGSDSGLVTQYKDVTDSGTDTEVSDLVAVTATTETGAGADVSTLVAGLAATDSGAGVDSGLFDAAAYSVTDTGSANDAVAAPDAVLTASDTGAGVDSSLLDTGSGTAVSASDSGAGSEVISFFEMVTGDMGGTQDSQGTETHSYTDYLRGASWTPAGNADWVDAEPWAMNGTFPYSTTYAEAVLPPFGVTDYLQVYDFDFFSDNLPPFAEDWGHPAGTIKLAVLSILAKTVEGTGVTLEARLKRATGSSGNYLSWAVPSTATWYDIEGLVVGPPREGWTQVWNVPAATANPGEWDHPKFGFEISAYNNVNATRTLRIESVQAYIIITHPRQENSNVSIAVSDSGSGTEAAGSVGVFGTDSGSATEASALTVSSTDDGAGTESSAVSNVVSATETTSGADVSILAALLGLTDTGSATESVQPSRSVGDSGVGTESLGSRVFASTELISVLDLGDANWWLAGAPTDNTLALTATSAGTETLVPYSAGTETLAAASSVTTEVLTAASTDTGLNLNPIDYEPQ